MLRETFKVLPDIGKYVETALDRNGVTVEGIAVRNQSLLIGFRGPCAKGYAYIASVPTDALFSNKVPTASDVASLPLGDNVGIRDIASVQDGLLILAGRSSDAEGDGTQSCGEDRPSPTVIPSLWFWSGKLDEAPERLGELPGIADADKAETLLVLDDNGSAYRILIMFDGRENGAPVEFNVKR